MDFATAWGHAHRLSTGGCPAMRYEPQLLKLILRDIAKIAQAVNADRFPMADAPIAYGQFNTSALAKYLLGPHGEL